MRVSRHDSTSRLELLPSCPAEAGREMQYFARAHFPLQAEWPDRHILHRRWAIPPTLTRVPRSHSVLGICFRQQASGNNDRRPPWFRRVFRDHIERKGIIDATAAQKPIATFWSRPPRKAQNTQQPRKILTPRDPLNLCPRPKFSFRNMSRLELGDLVYIARQHRCANANKIIWQASAPTTWRCRSLTRDFADACGFARSYMSRIERGTANLSLDGIERLTIAFGVSTEESFKGLSAPNE
jgi:transcriptional regulator with XRE-family HTH domain